MTIMSGISQELPFLRAEAESRMVDTWAIGTDLGWTYDEGSGVDVQTVTPLFTTLARLKVTAAVIRDAQVGARTAVETRRELSIPVNSPAVPVGAVAQCLAVDATSDPSLLGAIVRLSGSAPGAQTTARRLEVTEVLS